MNARERILDAAAEVMRTKGIAEATTREIARAAGCSEALLYKNFRDKQQIFTAVLKERMPALSTPEELLGRGEPMENLESLVGELIAFYREGFPVAASMLGSASLRAAHRASAEEFGGGPHAPALVVQRYLEGEADAGRLVVHGDAAAIARVVAGAALFEALQSSYADSSPDVPTLSAAIVDVVRHAVAPRASL